MTVPPGNDRAAVCTHGSETPRMDRSTLERKSVNDLREIAGQFDISGAGRMRKAELVDAIVGETTGGPDEDETGGGTSDEDATT